MAVYRVIYTLATYVNANSADEAEDMADEIDLDDFAFVDCEVERIKEED